MPRTLLLLAAVTALALACSVNAAFEMGFNQAWFSYANDFGNNRYLTATRTGLLDGLNKLKQSGGTLMRTWTHIDCRFTPVFNTSGHVVAADSAGTFITDLKRYIQDAHAMGLQVMPVLFNTGQSDELSANYKGLFYDDAKLQSYIDNVLAPLMAAIKDEPGLHSVDILNEPEGAAHRDVNEGSTDACELNSNYCWNGAEIPVIRMQRFMNHLLDAVKRFAPWVKVTVGMGAGMKWLSNEFPRHYAIMTDQCLIRAGGRANGVVDFYQFHQYTHYCHLENCPFLHPLASYKLDKPCMVGEYDHDEQGTWGTKYTAAELTCWFKEQGYNGALGWGVANAHEGPYYTLPPFNDGFTAVKNNVCPAVSACTDVPPPDSPYTCAQQVGWGKCDQPWMWQTGRCVRSCGICDNTKPTIQVDGPCTDIADPAWGGSYTCQQQVDWNHCQEPWMIWSGFCYASCGVCTASA